MRLPWLGFWYGMLPRGIPLFACSCVACVVLVLVPYATAQAQESTRTALILHSYGPDFPWTEQINNGMVETLNASGLPLDIRTEYMDTKFLASDEYLNQLVSNYTLKYNDYPIETILVSDDNGLRFLLRHRDEIFPGVPVVFCGINSYQGELYLQDELLAQTTNITGVVEQVEIEANLELVMRLHPDTQRILMFVDDSVTSQRNYQNAHNAVDKLKLPVEIVLHDDLSLSQVLALATHWGPGDVRVEIGTLKNDLGVIVAHTESCEAITTASRIPTYGCWSYLLGHGIIGGKIVDGRTQGRAAASMALQVLQGSPADSIPVQYTSPNLFVFDYTEIRHYGVDVNALPPDCVVLNKPETVFQHYPLQSSVALVLGVALMVVVIVLMLVNRSRGRVESALAASEESLRIAVQNVPVMLWAYDVDGLTLVWNRECEQVTGFTAQEIVGNPNALHLIYPDEANRQKLLEMRRNHPGDIEGWEHPVACKDGTSRIISMTNISSRYPVPGWASWGIGIDVTSRKRVEQQLRESREHFYRLVTLAQEGIVSVDEHENITFANPAFGIVLGYEPDELIGKSLLDFCDEDSRQRIFSGTEQRRRSVVSVYEIGLRTRSGELRDFLLSANPLLDGHGNYEGSLGVFTDITELKLTQEALLRSEESYRQLVEALPDGVLVLVGGQITYTNAAGLRTFHAKDSSELLGRVFDEFVDEDQYRRWQRFTESLYRGSSSQPALETILKRVDDSRVDVEIHAAQVRVDQQPGVQLIMRETHERKVLLQKMLNQQKDESVTTLAGGLAHDFNNILLGIMGAVNLLSQSESLPPDDLELCEVINSSAGRMADLTKKLLSFARSTKVQPQAVQVRKVVESAVAMSRGALPKKVQVNVELADDLWPMFIDPVQLEQALINLIINAGESMPDGGELWIGAANKRQPLPWSCSQHIHHEAGDYVQIRVRDSGTGMDAETQRRIFDPFFSTKFQGRGLGLAVTHGIVRAHHGCLTVASQPGQGSEFTLFLPRAGTDDDESPGDQTGVRGGSETILVIDDEEHVLRLTNRILSGYGYQVLVGLGAQGLAVFDDQASQINLVIVDRGLPDTAIRDLLAAARQHQPRLPVIISSGSDATEALAGLDGVELLGFVHKPYKSNDLAQIVREWLDQSKQ